jgi:YegS/Rv2252/BmrU family lipid kinase
MTTQSSSKQASKTYYLIFNPSSGSGEPGPDLTQIESALESVANLKVLLIKPDAEGEELARQALDNHADAVIAAGGDGTVSRVASALVNTDIPLGIIPTGTVNGFAKALRIPNNIADACDVIKAGHYKKVDTARCSEQMMLLSASIGFQAEVLSKMEREEKARLGRLAIVINSLDELRHIKQFRAEVQTPTHTWREPATSVMVANAATLSMVLAHGPASISPDDGMLSVTVVAPDHRWGVLTSALNLSLSALQGRFVQNEAVNSCKVTQVTIDTDLPQDVFVDGDPFGQTPVTITCHPRSLNVLTPQ